MNIVRMVKENPLLGFIYRRLTSVIEIVPYYLVREYLFEESELNLKPELDGFEVDFLKSLDMKAISESSEVNDSEDILLKRLDNGCICLGIKHKEDIAAYSWCNLRKCDYDGRLVFQLREDEAYLFDARTFQVYRGKKLAPYLRYQVYRHLAQMGRTKFFSTSSLLNTSAIKFKERLKARPIRLYLYINLLGKYHWNFLLKNYMSENELDYRRDLL